jgi:hypothetical protein
MLTVRVGKREPKLTVLTVDNYAPDIAAAERERVLERFCQAPGTVQ